MKVKYIGRYEVFPDRLFGTGAVWTRGEIKEVDLDVAMKMKAYVDSFVIADDEEVIPESDAQVVTEKPKQDKEQDDEDFFEQTVDDIRQMNRKDVIVDYIHEQWGIAVDKKGMSVVDLQDLAVMHLTNLGAVATDGNR